MSTGKKIAVVLATLGTLSVGAALPVAGAAPAPAPVPTDVGEPGCC